MEKYSVGDKVEHNLVPPGVLPAMEILEAKFCPSDNTRPEDHLQYRVVDWEGNVAWLCGYDARLVSRASE